MSYPQTQEKLATLIDLALDNPEIRASVDLTELTNLELKERLLLRFTEIWASAAKEHEEYETLEKEIESQKLERATVGSRLQRLLSATSSLVDGRGYLSRPTHQDKLAQRLAGLRNRIDETVIRQGILTALRLVINVSRKRRWSEKLEIVRGTGLGEIHDPIFEITTGAKARLEVLFRKMSGGNIGLAGPRGAGKTTLMSYFCGPAFESISSMKTLAILTPAPVEYEPRDFVLHLYALLCRRVLKIHKIDDELTGPSEPPPVSPQSAGLLRRLGTYCLTAGAVVAMMSFTAASYVNVSGTRYAGYLVNPAIFLSMATALVIAGFALRNVLGRQSATAEPAGESPLVTMALRHLEDIRFQHSYSSGWGGALKLPIGIEAQQSGARTLSRQQRSLPEIIEAYKQFVGELASEYRVIIGIDELDKIETDEKAHRFLNQIKALFNIPGCFYLLSVSENAISAFERRGLPIRDALDSSFDTIIYVDYLTLDESAQLLSRRVIGLSRPFIALCHCLSGGLPRDLIRTARDLIELSERQPPKDDLVELSQRIVTADVLSKARATSIAARDTYLRHTPELPDIEYAARTADLSAPALLAISIDLRKTVSTLEHLSGLDADDDAARDKLAVLIGELATYLYYAATLLEFFESGLFRDFQVERPAMFDIIADSRRSFAFRRGAARKILNSLRVAAGMDVAPEWHL